jgi:hypothetical protein
METVSAWQSNFVYKVGEAAEVLSRKKMSLAGAIYLSNVVIMARVRCIDSNCQVPLMNRSIRSKAPFDR